jgi:thiol-disulfide isomerase/thioredoxin
MEFSYVIVLALFIQVKPANSVAPECRPAKRLDLRLGYVGSAMSAVVNPYARIPDCRAEFVGKPAPDIRLKSERKEITLSSFRGKPVFVEFWSTWCAGCVQRIPELKELYAETAGKGLAWISVDCDEDPGASAKFVSEEQIPWPNYHDGDGTLGQAFGRQALPLGILIDSEGKVVFYSVGYDIWELREAIVKLGPQFGSVWR